LTSGPREWTEPVFIGVTGHRFLAEVDKLAAGIDEALDAVEATFPHHSLMAVTSLAEGADQLAADRILAREGAGLKVILPFSQAQILEEFPDAQSRATFQLLLDRAQETLEIPACKNKNDAYEAAGQKILECINVLLALWNGRVEHGRGGTGTVVRSARSQGLAIAWVHTGNRKPGTNVPTTLGREQGLVTFEGLPTQPVCREEKIR